MSSLRPRHDSWQQSLPWHCVFALVCAVCWLVDIHRVQAATRLGQDKASSVESEATEVVRTVLQFSDAGRVGETDPFDVDITKSELAGGAERAWEYQPYRVAVWICSDGSPELTAVTEQLKSKLGDLAELIDPSGWDLAIDAAPPQWRWSFQEHLDQPKYCDGFQQDPALKNFDKLILVTLKCESGQTTVRVREHDVTTGQWGPLVQRRIAQRWGLAGQVMDLVQVAFMPLARIDRVGEKAGARLSSRAVRACVHTRQTSVDTFESVPNSQSPVYIRSDDRFMPIIRRTDRKGDLLRLEPIDFTFLKVKEVDDAVVMCDIHSSQRAPLAQRKSKRAKKLALVIRAPQQMTTLKLVTNDLKAEAMPGVEVWSRRTEMTREDKSEFLGKTNWRGEIVIPPDEGRLRLIFIKRGRRALKKLPIVPGLYSEVVATVPNDQTRLFAQGVITGLSNDITALVIQRRVYESDFDAALEKKDIDGAKDVLRDYQELESPQDIRSRMTDEEIRLQTMTSDKRELGHIRKMFESLDGVLASEISKSRESELIERVQKMSGSR